MPKTTDHAPVAIESDAAIEKRAIALQHDLIAAHQKISRVDQAVASVMDAAMDGYRRRIAIVKPRTAANWLPPAEKRRINQELVAICTEGLGFFRGYAAKWDSLGTNERVEESARVAADSARAKELARMAEIQAQAAATEAALPRQPQMTIAEFIGGLAKRGIRIDTTPAGDITAIPHRALTHGDIYLLRSRKAEVVAALNDAPVVA